MRDAYRHENYDATRNAIREGSFDKGEGSVDNLRVNLRGFLDVETRDRLAAMPSGLHLLRLIRGCEHVGRRVDLFYVISGDDGIFGAAKVFYKPLPYQDSLLVTAEHEWAVSRQLDDAAVVSLASFRCNVMRYKARVDVGEGRLALVMPAYPRSLQDIMSDAHWNVRVPLPQAFLLRTFAGCTPWACAASQHRPVPLRRESRQHHVQQ